MTKQAGTVVDAGAPSVWIPIVALGIGAGCVSALQPVLLELLRQAGRLDVGTMGLAATCEAAGMTLASAVAALFFPLRNLRRIALVAIAGMMAANGGTMLASGLGIVALRLLNGLGSGTLLWIMVGLFARSPQPGRIFAIYVTAQSIVALALSQAMTALVVPYVGYRGGNGLLVLLNVAMLGAVAMMVNAFDDRREAGRGLPGIHGIAALLAMSCFLAGIMALWVYMLPVLGALGYDAAVMAKAVPLAIASQIAGGLAATVLAPRLRPDLAWALGAVGMLLATALIMGGAGAVAMLSGAALLGFVWIFVPPFQMPVILRIEPGGRGAMLVGTAQLVGTAIGPLAASPVVSAQGPLAAWHVSAAWIVASLVLLAFAATGNRAVRTAV